MYCIFVLPIWRGHEEVDAPEVEELETAGRELECRIPRAASPGPDERLSCLFHTWHVHPGFSSALGLHSSVPAVFVNVLSPSPPVSFSSNGGQLLLPCPVSHVLTSLQTRCSSAFRSISRSCRATRSAPSFLVPRVRMSVLTRAHLHMCSGHGPLLVPHAASRPTQRPRRPPRLHPRLPRTRS